MTGKKILRILKKSGKLITRYNHKSFKGAAPRFPEDLYNLMKKAVNMRKHLERNRKDKDSKYRLILVESKIHRLTRYYRKTGQVESKWK